MSVKVLGGYYYGLEKLLKYVPRLPKRSLKISKFWFEQLWVAENPVITCWLYLGQERLTPKYRLLHSGVSGWTKKVKYKASRNKRCFTLIQSLMRYSKSHFTNTEAFLTLNVITHSKVNNMYHRQNQILVFALDTDKTV